MLDLAHLSESSGQILDFATFLGLPKLVEYILENHQLSPVSRKSTTCRKMLYLLLHMVKKYKYFGSCCVRVQQKKQYIRLLGMPPNMDEKSP